MSEERAIIGWANIARMFRMPERTFRGRHGKELLELGACFKIDLGNPPSTYVCAFPSSLMRWAGLKQRAGEVI
jgi:hypothetical protein